MIMQGKTGEEYKKLLAGLSETEQREIKNYEKKFKETKLAEKTAENFFGNFQDKMKEKIKKYWYWLAFVISATVAYIVFFFCVCFVFQSTRKIVEYFFNL